VVHVDLERLAVAWRGNGGGERGAGRRIPPWLKWATLGVGAALCGAGAGLWAIDGGVTSDARYLHDTKGAGIALVSVGAVTMASSLALYLLARPSERGAAAVPRLAHGR
jgi:hypothetical protein